jgi:hypothetical protein
MSTGANFFFSAQRFRCASAILSRAAAESLCFFGGIDAIGGVAGRCTGCSVADLAMSVRACWNRAISSSSAAMIRCLFSSNDIIWIRLPLNFAFWQRSQAFLYLKV